MVVIDATMLMPLLRPDIPVPAARGGVPIEKVKERIDHLIKTLEKEKNQDSCSNSSVERNSCSRGCGSVR